MDDAAHLSIGARLLRVLGFVVRSGLDTAMWMQDAVLPARPGVVIVQMALFCKASSILL